MSYSLLLTWPPVVSVWPWSPCVYDWSNHSGQPCRGRGCHARLMQGRPLLMFRLISGFYESTMGCSNENQRIYSVKSRQTSFPVAVNFCCSSESSASLTVDLVFHLSFPPKAHVRLCPLQAVELLYSIAGIWGIKFPSSIFFSRKLLASSRRDAQLCLTLSSAHTLTWRHREECWEAYLVYYMHYIDSNQIIDMDISQPSVISDWRKMCRNPQQNKIKMRRMERNRGFFSCSWI